VGVGGKRGWGVNKSDRKILFRDPAHNLQAANEATASKIQLCTHDVSSDAPLTAASRSVTPASIAPVDDDDAGLRCTSVQSCQV